MKIIVYAKQVYGQTLLYVAGPAADHIGKLTRRKTVENADIQALRALGHEVEIFEGETMARAAAAQEGQ